MLQPWPVCVTSCAHTLADIDSSRNGSTDIHALFVVQMLCDPLDVVG